MELKVQPSTIINKIQQAERTFNAHVADLRPRDAVAFRRAFNDAGERLWRGEISLTAYEGITGELKRDMRGTAAGYRAPRPAYDNRPRGVVRFNSMGV